MQRLCQETKTALLWITHDLAVVAGIAERICVMYAGRVVEQGPNANVIAAPMHPYTTGLAWQCARAKPARPTLAADRRHGAIIDESANGLCVSEPV